MAKRKKVSSSGDGTSTIKRDLLMLKRELKAEVKSARESAIRAKKLAVDVDKARTEVFRAIESLLAQQEELEMKVGNMESRWTECVQRQDNIELIVDRLAEGYGGGGSGSGTRSSPFGRVADEGVQGRRLPGSFESRVPRR